MFSATDPSSGGVSSGVNHLECNLDGTSYALCTSPVSLTGLSDGSHTFYVRAIDDAGNTESTPATWTWVIDTVAPTAVITFPVHGGAYSEASWDAGCSSIPGDACGTASDPAPASGVNKVEFSIQQVATGKFWNGTSFSSATEVSTNVGTTTWSNAFPFSNFPTTGQYTMHANATDAAGNSQVNPTTSSFQINRYTLDYLTPIDDSTPINLVLNTGKNGRVIPVKVNVFLEGVQQTSMQIAEGRLTIKVVGVDCGAQTAVDPLESYADAAPRMATPTSSAHPVRPGSTTSTRPGSS